MNNSDERDYAEEQANRRLLEEGDAEPCGKVADNAPGACILGAGHPDRHRDAEGFVWHEHGFKHGRPDVYEITWMSGHTERVLAHQVTYPQAGMMLGSAFGLAAEVGAPRVRMHAEIDGRWCLTLGAREEDIRTMRLVTGGELIPGSDLPPHTGSAS